MENLNRKMIEAVKGHFEAEKAKALANLDIYLGTPVGIGEHSDVVGEAILLVQRAAEAHDSLCMLAIVTQEGPDYVHRGELGDLVRWANDTFISLDDDGRE